MKLALAAAALASAAFLTLPAQAAPVSPSSAITSEVTKSGSAENIHWHNRWRSHHRWGSHGGWHNRWRSHHRWGSHR